MGNGVPVLSHIYPLYVYLLKHQPANLANINKHTMSKKRTNIFMKIALKDNAFTWFFFSLYVKISSINDVTLEGKKRGNKNIDFG